MQAAKGVLNANLNLRRELNAKSYTALEKASMDAVLDGKKLFVTCMCRLPQTFPLPGTFEGKGDIVVGAVFDPMELIQWVVSRRNGQSV
jgi:hypothetical protein